MLLLLFSFEFGDVAMFAFHCRILEYQKVAL